MAVPASDLLADLQRRGLRIRAQGDSLLVEPRGLLTDELRATIRANKPALLQVLTIDTFERRRALVVRELQEHPELRVSTHVQNAPMKPEQGDPVSVVIAVRTEGAGIVSAEFSVPRERFDWVLFCEALEHTSRRPS